MIPSLERYIRAMFDLSKIFTRLEAATNRISGEYLKEIEKKKRWGRYKRLKKGKKIV